MTSFNGLDCMLCGACCYNPSDNRAEGRTDTIEVEPDSRLLTRDELRKRYVRVDESGVGYMRFEPNGRCVGLKGKLGEACSCRIYADRPRGCRLVEKGSKACLLARADMGLDEKPIELAGFRWSKLR